MTIKRKENTFLVTPKRQKQPLASTGGKIDGKDKNYNAGEKRPQRSDFEFLTSDVLHFYSTKHSSFAAFAVKGKL